MKGHHGLRKDRDRLADETQGRVRKPALESPSIGAAEPHRRGPGGIDCRHDALVDEAREDRDHDRQDPLVGHPQSAFESRWDLHRLKPAARLGASTVDDNRHVAGLASAATSRNVVSAAPSVLPPILITRPGRAHVW